LTDAADSGNKGNTERQDIAPLLGFGFPGAPANQSSDYFQEAFADEKRDSKKFRLAFSPGRTKKDVFFEIANLVFALYRNQMSGNPVKIGDGCATVTGYKLPSPLAFAGKAGARSSPKSGYRFACARPGRKAAGACCGFCGCLAINPQP